ncbi:expressed unknown protein [Seminavis robusta]|uniref:J domain-containing protein n=1 Tax=Seminavis robusta TaxID=568900 RepID=A0A9N8DEU9_9STRA|nr:expressed unknown protein [Seminavis robusta]|eukprot:Sro110_g054850.1 n/a (1643) ;mRNA; f:40755-45683
MSLSSSSKGAGRLLSDSSSPNVGYPEAFYAHTHKTPERSNRQRKLPTPPTDPITPDSNNGNSNRRSSGPPGNRVVGRLRPNQLNLFAGSSGSSNPSVSGGSVSGSTGSSGGNGNVGNGYSHIQQQIQRQYQPQQPPAARSSIQESTGSSSNRSVASVGSTATLAATIPSSHVNIITQAYGNNADIYEDILKIPRQMTSEREIRIAYFRRGRQVLAERPNALLGSSSVSSASSKVSTNVSHLAKMRFQAVSMAYEILSNPAWKESYDLYGLYGPDAFQEPTGSASMLAEDASLADPTDVAQRRILSASSSSSDHSIHRSDSSGSSKKPDPETALSNVRTTPDEDNVSKALSPKSPHSDTSMQPVRQERQTQQPKRNSAILQAWQQRQQRTLSPLTVSTLKASQRQQHGSLSPTSPTQESSSQSALQQQSSSSPTTHGSISPSAQLAEQMSSSSLDTATAIQALQLQLLASLSSTSADAPTPMSTREQQRDVSPANVNSPILQPQEQPQDSQPNPSPVDTAMPLHGRHQPQPDSSQGSSPPLSSSAVVAIGTGNSPIPNYPSISPSTTAVENNMNGDNLSCVSQSTTGTASSGGVLRKTGSFLEKLNKNRSNGRKKNGSSGQQAVQTKDVTNGPELPPVPSTTVRWNEEVEELIFRQDPDEISFKAGMTTVPAESTSDQEADKSQEVQLPQPPQRQPQQQQQQHEYKQSMSKPTSTPASNPAATRALDLRQRQQGYPPNSAGDGDGARRSGAPRPRIEGRDSGGKQRVVLDTAELGSHLKKLDKVADSIAGIFDELEASFDDLLGGLKTSPTAAGANDGSPNPAFQAPMASSKLEQPQLRDGVQQQHQLGSQPPLPSRRRIQAQEVPPGIVSSRINAQTQGFVDSTQKPAGKSGRHFEEASYHTPPTPIGSSQWVGQHQQGDVGTTKLSRQEELEVEAQAMALLREISTSESMPPSDVVVKTKKSKHLSLHHQSNAQFHTVPEHSHHEHFGADETESPLACDMTAGGENTTVATSVVSLLDAEKHSNAPLKPAATTGVQSSRKRLKHLQRRRQQQQRAKEKQPDFQNDDDVMISVGNKVKLWSQNQLANPAAEESEKHKKDSRKKKTEDQYFESLYQNFFLLPKERLPHEMTVRMKPHKSSCSVSTLSHSEFTEQLPTGDFDLEDFDPWGAAGKDVNVEKERRAKHHREVLARVDKMLEDRNSVSGVDTTFDSSFPDDDGVNTSFDSNTAVDTSFESSAVDTAYSSALSPRRPSAMNGCETTPEQFLNSVFNVPIEAPLEFWCGELKDCASSTKPSKEKRLIKPSRPEKQQKPRKSARKVRPQQDPAGSNSSRDDDDESVDEPNNPIDETITLLDPPTHDSRIDLSRGDDSTLNTLNTNNLDEVEEEEPRRTAIDPSTSPVPTGITGIDPSVCSPMGIDPSTATSPVPSLDGSFFVRSPGIKSPKEAEEEDATDPSEDVYAAHFEVIQESGSDDTLDELAQCGSDSNPEMIKSAQEEEEREGASSVPTPDIEYDQSIDSGSVVELVPSPSSLSARGIEIDSEFPNQDQLMDDGMDSSTASAAVSGKRSPSSSSMMAHLLKYVETAAEDNPSLACLRANLSCGFEAWRASNACLEAMVISDEDMSGVLDIIEQEMKAMPSKTSSE